VYVPASVSEGRGSLARPPRPAGSTATTGPANYSVFERRYGAAVLSSAPAPRTEKCQLSTEKCQLSTDKCQLSTEKCQLSTAKCQLSTEKCQLRTEKCQLSTEKCQLSAEKCQLSTEKCQLSTEKCQLSTEKCQFSVHLPGSQGPAVPTRRRCWRSHRRRGSSRPCAHTHQPSR
jgi:hypothetical protein